MNRRLAYVVIVVASCLSLAACGSSGAHTQSISPSPTPSTSVPPTVSPTSTSTSTSASATDSPASSSAGVPTPTVTPSGQAAVDAYVADFNADTAASRDPANADLAWIAQYETGTARTQTEQSYANLKASHLAFRGKAPNPSVKVQSVLSSTAVTLTSCLLVDKSDPWIEYDTTTGKAVPVATRNPPPPYLLTIFMKASGSQWQIYDVLQNSSKTCQG